MSGCVTNQASVIFAALAWREPSWRPMCMREVRIEGRHAAGHADVGRLRAVLYEDVRFGHAVFLEEFAYVVGENRAGPRFPAGFR